VPSKSAAANDFPFMIIRLYWLAIAEGGNFTRDFDPRIPRAVLRSTQADFGRPSLPLSRDHGPMGNAFGAAVNCAHVGLPAADRSFLPIEGARQQLRRVSREASRWE